jgi:hypothetical protein
MRRASPDTSRLQQTVAMVGGAVMGEMALRDLSDRMVLPLFVPILVKGFQVGKAAEVETLAWEVPVEMVAIQDFVQSDS